jgi:molybdenum cofactor synthesis domain-containing protein
MIKVGVLIISDRAYSGERPDETIPTLKSELTGNDEFSLSAEQIVPDEKVAIGEAIVDLASRCDLLFTSGGTGFAPRDITPEVTSELIEKRADQIIGYLMMGSLKFSAYAPLTRGIAGSRGKCLIINLPGKPKSVVESFQILSPIIPHAIKVLKGQVSDCKEELR